MVTQATPAEVESNLKEYLEWYLRSNSDPDFQHDEALYDGFVAAAPEPSPPAPELPQQLPSILEEEPDSPQAISGPKPYVPRKGFQRLPEFNWSNKSAVP